MRLSNVSTHGLRALAQCLTSYMTKPLAKPDCRRWLESRIKSERQRVSATVLAGSIKTLKVFRSAQRNCYEVAVENFKTSNNRSMFTKGLSRAFAHLNIRSSRMLGSGVSDPDRRVEVLGFQLSLSEKARGPRPSHFLVSPNVVFCCQRKLYSRRSFSDSDIHVASFHQESALESTSWASGRGPV